MPGLELAEGLGDTVKGLAQHRQQRLALAGEHQATGQALEQDDVELYLQALDLMADRRLGHAQLDGRPGKAQMPGGGFESTQCIKG